MLDVIPRDSFLRSRASRWRTLLSLRRWSRRDERASRFYSQFIRSGETCFDIGANRGNRTKIFTALGARVIAVEPQAGCASLLRQAFARDSSVTVVETACGAHEGRARMMIAGYDGLSSLSEDWISAVRATRRFGDIEWKAAADVAVTTLDSLIRTYGEPVFIKIDVEGSETDVLQGLSKPVRGLSFEFTPECMEAALACVQRLKALGFREFNISAGESMELTYPEWLDADRIAERLLEYRGRAGFFGDVYGRPGAD
jgi:FkbM family methyltransferase